MRTKNFFLTLLLTAMIFVPFAANAQITIGSGDAPQSFSVLELISNQSGLRLPQMTRSERNIMMETDEFQTEKTSKAMGLMIFNTDIRCVETWNGDRWVRSRNCPCGAYIAPGDWRQFMCHNLGADTSLDPFTPHAGLHGAMFKWGTGIVAMTAQEVAAISTAPTNPDWEERGGTPPTGTDDWDMTTANPCPPGFRIPTADEWRGVIANNPMRRVGTWTANNNPSGQGGNFSSGTHFGDALFLPAAGFRGRGNPSGGQGSRGSTGNYWSSTASGTGAFILWLRGTVQNSIPIINDIDRAIVGHSVRCISVE